MSDSQFPNPQDPTTPPPPAYSMPPAPYAPYGQPAYVAPATQQPGSGLYLAAAIINWVTLGLIVVATCGFGIVAAAWYVPMTIYIHKATKDPWKHTALSVCTLLFCNLIAGILMLVADSERRERPLA